MDRNSFGLSGADTVPVALRKESVDRNPLMCFTRLMPLTVALRKESVDRNIIKITQNTPAAASLSARRAWIEILIFAQ